MQRKKAIEVIDEDDKGEKIRKNWVDGEWFLKCIFTSFIQWKLSCDLSHYILYLIENQCCNTMNNGISKKWWQIKRNHNC